MQHGRLSVEKTSFAQKTTVDDYDGKMCFGFLSCYLQHVINAQHVHFVLS